MICGAITFSYIAIKHYQTKNIYAHYAPRQTPLIAKIGAMPYTKQLNCHRDPNIFNGKGNCNEWKL